MVKICTRCLQVLSIEAFPRDRSRKDGRTSACQKCRTAKRKCWVVENRDKTNAIQGRYYRRNQKEIVAKQTAAVREDVQRKLSLYLRNRLNMAIKIDQKSGSAVRDLGCSVTELIRRLEAQFQPGMTWENYGFYGWHVDHILPLASFDLTDREQFLKACHYTNLRPMWGKENMSKGARL